MSTDWCKYSKPKDTRARGSKGPIDQAVIALNVGAVRAIPGQEVKHTPDVKNNNQAHTDVFGPKNEKERIFLARIATQEGWMIKVDDPIDES